jgi:hypothetical protein
VLADNDKTATDPHFKDLVLFHEYIHSETGRGVGASHQTGWTGLVADLLTHETHMGAADVAKPAKSQIQLEPQGIQS